MMKGQPSKRLKPLLAVHVLLMFGLAGAWAYHCWTFLPADLLDRLSAAGTADAAGAYLEPFLNDSILGMATVLIFGLGTGVYVHRLQVWIEGRGSGQAMALRGANLNDQAIAANPPSAKKR